MRLDVRAAIAACLCLLACSSPPPSGAGARHQNVEIPITRFCACGAWPAEGCPPYRLNEIEALCFDAVYERFTDQIIDNTLCMERARFALDDCLFEGEACAVCRDRWASATTACPPIGARAQRELDICIAER